MAILVVFDAPEMTTAQYDQVINDLEAAGLGNPDGRIFHAAAAQGEGMFVSDVWESEEQFNRFGEALIPIIVATGATPAEPTIYRIHNTLS